MPPLPHFSTVWLSSQAPLHTRLKYKYSSWPQQDTNKCLVVTLGYQRLYELNQSSTITLAPSLFTLIVQSVNPDLVFLLGIQTNHTVGMFSNKPQWCIQIYVMRVVAVTPAEQKLFFCINNKYNIHENLWALEVAGAPFGSEVAAAQVAVDPKESQSIVESWDWLQRFFW